MLGSFLILWISEDVKSLGRLPECEIYRECVELIMCVYVCLCGCKWMYVWMWVWEWGRQ